MSSKKPAPKAAPKPAPKVEAKAEPAPTPEPEESGAVTVTRTVNGHHLSNTAPSKAEANRNLDAYVKERKL